MKTHIKSTAKVEFKVIFELDEVQARALDALVGYGATPFIKSFYKVMGRHYLEPYEGGLRRLFRAVEEQVLPELTRIDQLRKVIAEETGRSKKAPRYEISGPTATYKGPQAGGGVQGRSVPRPSPTWQPSSPGTPD